MAEKLLVNPIDCEGHGACAELLPEAITIDEWGYPIVDPRPLPPSLEGHARAAVSACPTWPSASSARKSRTTARTKPKSQHPNGCVLRPQAKHAPVLS
jgi:ferredoxin